MISEAVGCAEEEDLEIEVEISPIKRKGDNRKNSKRNGKHDRKAT